MDLWRIAVRALVAYIYLLVMARASGKRVVSQATPFDFVMSLILGDLIDDALWAEVETAKFGAAVASVCLCDMIVKLATFHSRRVFRLVEGVPRKVVRDGRADRDGLRREQLNELDLEHLLRLEGLEHRSAVKLALIEYDHEMSVIYRPGAEPATRADAKKVKESRS
jgi:uncharacterized membrane protein YcaP (DUF421 family)